jgi:hypothetical protein
MRPTVMINRRYLTSFLQSIFNWSKRDKYHFVRDSKEGRIAFVFFREMGPNLHNRWKFRITYLFQWQYSVWYGTPEAADMILSGAQEEFHIRVPPAWHLNIIVTKFRLKSRYIKVDNVHLMISYRRRNHYVQRTRVVRTDTVLHNTTPSKR